MTKEKITKRFTRRLKMPQLYREDLESIEQVINELSPKDYRLEVADYKYDKLKSIPEDTETTTEFRIVTNDIDIYFSKNNASISVDKDDLKTTGAKDKIITIISRTERKLLYFVDKLATIFVLPFWFFIWLEKIQIALVRLALLWFLTFIAIWCVYIANKKFSTINFFYKKDSPLGFFRKITDEIISAVIAGVILLIIGQIFWPLLKKLAKSQFGFEIS